MPEPGTANEAWLRHARCPAGFTLVEILIVVVILAILAAVVFVFINDTIDSAARNAFGADMRTFANAAYFYSSRTGEFLEDSSTGQVPAGWAPYVNVDKWTGGTPIGGEWDFELDSFGIKSGFGVHFNGVAPRSDSFMQKIDQAFDDGDLATGGFRKLAADRFYFVIQ